MIHMIDDLIDELKQMGTCIVYPPGKSIAINESGRQIPEDLERFYQLCGGIDFYPDDPVRQFRIFASSDVRLATPVIRKELFEECPEDYANDISQFWYLLGNQGREENLVIDLHPDRVGRCYDGYIGTYASSDCRIISDSFTDALKMFVASGGEWNLSKVGELGYAYDGLDIEPPGG